MVCYVSCADDSYIHCFMLVGVDICHLVCYIYNVKVSSIDTESYKCLLAALDQNAEVNGLASLPDVADIKQRHMDTYCSLPRKDVLRKLSSYLDVEIEEDTDLESLLPALGNQAMQLLIEEHEAAGPAAALLQM